VSEAGARSRNPERSEGTAALSESKGSCARPPARPAVNEQRGLRFAEEFPRRPQCTLWLAIFSTHLLHVNHLPACVQGSAHPDFLAIKLLHFVLMIDVISRARGRVLQHILVPLLYDRSSKGLSASLIRRLCLRSLLPGALARCGLIWSLLAGLIRRLPRSRRLRVG